MSRVHNLTDVSTPALVGAGLVNVSIKIGGSLIPPGESAELVRVPAEASRYQRVDAIFVGTNPPPKYLAAKEKQKPAVRKQLSVGSKVEAKSDVTTMKTDPPPKSRKRFGSEE